MYKGMFDDKHKIIYASIKSSNFNKLEKIYKFSAEYDLEILCQECDNNIIGSYESYARTSFFCSIDKNPQIFDGNDFQPITINVDYKRFKLFLLSILWRSSVSKRALFKNVTLGPHGEKLRKMIYEGDPKSVSDYPIVLWTYKNDKEFPSEIVAEPSASRRNSGIVYVFIIGGIVYVYHVSKSTVDNFVIQHTVRSTNEISIMLLPKGRTRNLFRTHYHVR